MGLFAAYIHCVFGHLLETWGPSMTGGLASNLHRIVTFNLTNRIKMKSRHFQQMINLGHWTIISPSCGYVQSVFGVNKVRICEELRIGVSISWQFASKCVFDDPHWPSDLPHVPGASAAIYLIPWASLEIFSKWRLNMILIGVKF